jgi:D-glycero-alpha-D-manno-heptose-7-phosphate kinase
MIICRTPFRISFFGGGTDFPEFFSKGRGAVLGTAIDKYVYHSVLPFPSALFDYAVRLSYSQVEHVQTLEDVQHRPFREALRSCGIEKDIEISLSADLPSFSGLGSSSSFIVGLLNALTVFRGECLAPEALAHRAIDLERNVLGECVGYQDQVFAAYGGLNLIEFTGEDEFRVERLSLSAGRLGALESSSLLFFTGLRRSAAEVEQQKLNRLGEITDTLKRMLLLVEKAHDLLTGNRPLAEFGSLLDSTWQEKRTLAPGVSSARIDRMYSLAREGGALGGKLLGAGAGGFMLFFVPEERQASVRTKLAEFPEIAFSMNAAGSSIVYS